MALKYQALNGMVINKTTTIEGYNPTNISAIRLGVMPVRFATFDSKRTLKKQYLIDYEVEGAGFLAPIGATTSFPSNTTLTSKSAIDTIGALTNFTSGEFCGVSGVDTEGNKYLGSGNSRFGFYTQGKSFKYNNTNTDTIYSGYLCSPSGTLKAIFFRNATHNIDTIEVKVDATQTYLNDPLFGTSSSNKYFKAGLYFDIPKANEDIVLYLQFIPDEITETQELIVPTLVETGDGYCNFQFKNTNNMPVDVVIENQKYVVLPNSTSTIRIEGTNDTLNTKSYYCKSFWKHDSEVGTIEFTPTAS